MHVFFWKKKKSSAVGILVLLLYEVYLKKRRILVRFGWMLNRWDCVHHQYNGPKMFAYLMQ